MPGPSDSPPDGPAAGPLELRPGLTVAAVRTTITGPMTSTRPAHALLVNVGRPYRLVETLGDVARPTAGAPGDVAVVPAGMPLTAHSLDGTPQPLECLLVLLSPALVAEVVDAAGPRSPRPELLPVVGSRSPAVAQLASVLHAGLGDRTALGRLAREQLGSALAVAVVRDHSATGPPAGGDPPEPGRGLGRAQLQAVLRLVEDELSAPLSVAELAARAAVSPFHFSRLFRSATGQSPHQYVLQRRLARARELLAGTDVPIGLVAARCGFADQSHLTRQTRRHLGTTPAALRAAARGR